MEPVFRLGYLQQFANRWEEETTGKKNSSVENEIGRGNWKHKQHKVESK